MARLAFRASEPIPILLLCFGTILGFVIHSSHAGPTGGRGSAQCSTFCQDQSKLSFEPGLLYQYDYSMDITTAVVDGSSTESRLRVAANAEISALTACEVELQLLNVKIHDSDSTDGKVQHGFPDTNTLSEELSRRALRFSYQNGKVEHLCPEKSEPVWVLNIKRGILSTLQNTMEDLNQDESVVPELDVGGKCPTTYKHAGNAFGGGQSIVKEKQFGTCSLRNHHLTALQTVAYTSSSSDAHTFSLLEGTQECTQSIRNKKIEKVHCREQHKFQPFSDKKDSGTQTTVTQSLVFINSHEMHDSKSNTFDLSHSRKVSLLYEHHESIVVSDKLNSRISSILETLEKHEGEARPETPQMFTELVENLRVLSYPAMKALFATTKSDAGKQFLMDAMPRVGTAGSMEFMKDLLLNRQLTDNQADAWLTTVAFIKEPNVDMISALNPLLFERHPRNQALLGISSLIYTYCQQDDDCTEKEAVNSALIQMYSLLGTSCSVSKYNVEDLTSMLVTLKSIGNAGHAPRSIHEDYLTTLYSCHQEKSNPTEIRIASVDALRRMSCNTINLDKILNVYKDMQEETEVRIKAYLLNMRCYDRQTLDAIKTTLYNEDVNQVGSYVWTHLTNLKETSSPDKNAIKQLLSHQILKNKFNTDARKYSRNYEASFFSEEYNLGATVDTDVIFTSESFLPKSGMLNLTTHMFGQSVNLIEFGGRVHSLENLLEPLFGPNGYFPDETISEKLINPTRAKRDVSLSRLESIYEESSRTQQKSPGGTFYTRIFGHEIMFKSLEYSDDESIPALVDETGKNWFDATYMLHRLSIGKSTKFSRSDILMDFGYTVATSAGIPLKLNVQVASTIGMSATGKFDVARFIETKELSIHGSLEPSAAVKVDGSMTVLIGPTGQSLQSGLRTENTLHSATGIKGNLLIKGSKMLHAAFSFPKDRQEIFSAKSQLVVIHPLREKSKAVKGMEGTPKVIDEICSSSYISELFGMKLCGEINAPEQFSFPLTTPASVSVFLEKTDNFDSYEFDYKLDNSHSLTAFNIMFNTPGSKVPRRMAADFILDRMSKKLNFGIEIPSATIRAEALYTKNEKRFQGAMTSYDEKVLFIDAILKQQDGRYEPHFLMMFYNKPIAELRGHIDLTGLRKEIGKGTMELSLRHVTKMPIKFKGEVAKTGEKYDVNFEMESYLLSGTVRSQLRMKPDHFSTKLNMHYSWKQAETQSLDFSTKFQKFHKGTLTRWNLAMSFACSNFPEHDIDLSWDIQASNGFCENQAKFTMGKSVWEGHTLYNHQSTKQQRNLNLQLSLLAPRHDVDYSFGLSHFHTRFNLSTACFVRTDVNTEYKARIEYLSDEDFLLRKVLMADVSWPDEDYTLRATLLEKSPGEFEGELVINPNRMPEMKATMTYVNKSNNVRVDHLLEFRARGFFENPVSGNAALSASDRQSHIGGLLEIEGNSTNSGRWSTSLDYTFLKKNTHKVEGKLTLNNLKYTGELNFRQTKSGEYVAILDMDFEKHIRAEAKCNTMIPDQISASFTLMPDYDTESSIMFDVTGSVSFESLNLKIDNFGQIFTLSGTYDGGMAELNAEWGKDQRFRIAVNAPVFTLNKILFTADVETPFEGFKDCSVKIRHLLDTKELSTELHGRVEQNSAALKAVSSWGTSQTKYSFLADVHGFKIFETGLIYGFTDDEKILNFRLKRGNDEGKANFHFIRIEGSHTLKAELTGIKYLPELNFVAENQSSEKIAATFEATWIPTNETASNQVLISFSGTKDPLTVHCSVSTPWEPLTQFTVDVYITNDAESRQIKINLNGNYEIMPVLILGDLQGDLTDFKYGAVLSYGDNQTREIKVGGKGNFWDVTNAELVTSFTQDGKHSTMSLVSKNTKGTQKIELTLNDNGKSTNAGVSWYYTDQWKSFQASAWGSTPTHPQVLLDFSHKRNNTAFEAMTKITKSDQIIAQMDLGVMKQPYEWRVETIFKSFFQSVPDVSLLVVHNAQNLSSIAHQFNFYLIKSPRFLRQFYDKDKIKLSTRFVVQDAKNIEGSVAWDDKTWTMTGQITENTNGTEVSVKLSSSTTKIPVEVSVGYENKVNSYRVFSTVQSGAEQLAYVILIAEQNETQMSASFDFDCSFGSKMIGNAKLDFEKHSLDASIKSNEETLLLLHASAEIALVESNMKLEIQSPLVKSLDNLKIEVQHSISPTGVTAKVVYIDGSVHNEYSLDGKWGTEVKTFVVSASGQHNGKIQIVFKDSGTLTASAEYDGKQLGTLEVHYKQESSDFSFGKHNLNILLTLPDHSYNVIITLGLDLNKLHLDCETPFVGWKKLSLVAEGNLETPTKTFTLIFAKDNSVYKVDSKLQATVTEGVAWLHVETPYTGYHKLDCRISYNLVNKLEMTIEVAKESDKVRFKTIWLDNELDAVLETPLVLAKQIILSGKWKLESKTKHVNLKASINQEVYTLDAIWELELLRGNGKILVTASETYVFDANYDFTKRYQVLATLNASGQIKNIGGTFVLQENALSVEILTPISGYERLKFAASYNSPLKGQHIIDVDWNLNGTSNRMQLNATLESGKVIVKGQTPFEPWHNVIAEISHDFSSLKKALNVSVQRGDMKKVAFSGELQITGKLTQWNESVIVMAAANVQTPLDQLRTMQFSTEYGRGTDLETQSLKLTAESTDDQGRISHMNASYRNNLTDTEIQGGLTIPGYLERQANMLWTKKKPSVTRWNAQVSLEGKQHSIEGIFTLERDLFNVQLNTTFPWLKNFQLNAKHALPETLSARLKLNDNQLDIQGELNLYGWERSSVKLLLKTPFRGFKSLVAEGKVGVQSDKLDTSILFQNDRVRYMAKLQGSYSSTSGTFILQANTPMYYYENLQSTFDFSFDPKNPVVKAVYYRNGNQEAGLLFSLSLLRKEFQTTLSSALQQVPIDAKFTLDWGVIPPKMNFGVNGSWKQHRGTIKLGINGFSKIDVDVTTSIVGWERINAEWILQGDTNLGDAKVKVDTTQFGKYSIRSSWKRDNWDAVKVDLWYTAPEDDKEQGISIQYYLTPNREKFDSSLLYLFDEEEKELKALVSVQRGKEGNMFEASLTTPFSMLEQASVTAKWNFSPEVYIYISCGHNQQAVFQAEGTFVITPLKSKLMLHFVCPQICEPFSLNAAYDLLSKEKLLIFAFSQSQYSLEIKAEAVVPEDSTQIELKMNVDSNVPSVEMTVSGSLHAGYKIELDNTTVISVSLDSEYIGKWNASAALRPSTNFHARFQLESPIPKTVPSIVTEVNWRGNMVQGISSDVKIQFAESPEFVCALSLTADQIRLSVISGLPGYENVSVLGRLDVSSESNKKFEIEVQAGDEKVSLTGTLKIPPQSSSIHGSLDLQSSWNVIPTGFLAIKVEENGKIQLQGTWAGKSVGISGSLQALNNLPWWKSAETSVVVTFDSVELCKIKLHHLFHSQEYSLNATVGSDYVLDTYIFTGRHKTVMARVKWDEKKEVRFFGESAAGKFLITFTSPWFSEIKTHGQYAILSNEVSAKVALTYEAIESSLHVLSVFFSDSFQAKVNVNLPQLQQKADCVLNIRKLEENSLEVKTEIRMNDRLVTVLGLLQTKEYEHSELKRVKDRKLSLVVSLPGTSYSEILAEVTVIKPVTCCSNIRIVSTLILQSEVSKLNFGYDLPSELSQVTGASIMISSPYLVAEPMEITFTTDSSNLRKFSGKLQYQANGANLSWDTMDWPNYAADFVLLVPGSMHQLNTYRLHLDGTFDLNRQLQISASAECKKVKYLLEATLGKDEMNNVNSKFKIDAPGFIQQPLEVNVILRRTTFHQYVLDLTGTRGPKAFEFSGYLNNEDEISLFGKLGGSYGSHSVKLDVTPTKDSYGFTAEITGESLTLLKGKKASASVRLTPSQMDHGFDIQIECQTRQALHSGRISVHFGQNSYVSLKLDSPSFSPFAVEANWILDGIEKKGKLEVYMSDLKHQVEAYVNSKDWEIRLFALCPIWSPQEFNLHLKLITESNHLQLMGDAKMYEVHWHFETTVRYVDIRDMEIKLEVISPIETFDKLVLALRSLPGGFFLEIRTPIENVPNVLLSLQGIAALETGTWSNMNPSIIIGLPWVTYTAKGILRVPSDVIPGELQFILKQDKEDEDAEMYDFHYEMSALREFNLHMLSPVKIKLHAETPMESFKNIDFELGGRFQWANWFEIQSSGGFNNQKLNLSAAVGSYDDVQKMYAELHTPFQGYETFLFSVRSQAYSQLGSGRSIYGEFYKPSWTKPLHIEVDYRYKFDGFTDMDGELGVSAPFFKIPSLSIRLESQVKESRYHGLVEGTWSSYNPHLKIDSVLLPTGLTTILEATAGPGSKYHYQTKIHVERTTHEVIAEVEVVQKSFPIVMLKFNFSNPLERIQGELVVKTQWAFLKSAVAKVKIFPLNPQDGMSVWDIIEDLQLDLGLDYNSRKVVQLTLESRKGRRHLVIHNPLRPVSLVLTFERPSANRFMINGEVCWNLKEPGTSTIGLQLGFGKSSYGKDVFFVIQAAESGSVGMTISHVLTSARLNQIVQLKWNRTVTNSSGQIGYKLQFNDDSDSRGLHYDIVTIIDTPWRSLQLNTNVYTKDKEGKYHIDLLWDRERDSSKQIGVTMSRKRLVAWRGHTLVHTVTIRHGTISNDLVITVEQSYKNNILQHVEAAIKPTSLLKDQVTIGYYRTLTGDNKITVFLTHQASNVNIRGLLTQNDTNVHGSLYYMDIHGQQQAFMFTVLNDKNVNQFLEVHGGPVSNLQRLVYMDCQPQDDKYILNVHAFGVKIAGFVQHSLPYLEANIRYDEDRQLHLTAGLPDKREVSLKFIREEHRHTTNEVIAIVRLNATNLLSGRLIWRPELLDEIQNYILKSALKNTREMVFAVARHTSEILREEIGGRWEMLSPTMQESLLSLKTFSVSEYNAFIKEMEQLGDILQHLEQQNFLHIQDISNTLLSYANTIYSVCDKILRVSGKVVSLMCRKLCDVGSKLIGFVVNNAGNMEHTVMKIWDEMENLGMQYWKDVFKWFTELSEWLEEKYEFIEDAIEGRLDALEDKILAISVIRKVVRLYKEYVVWLNDLPIREYFNALTDFFHENIWAPLEKHYKPYVDALIQSMKNGKLTAFLETPPFPFLRHVCDKISLALSKVIDFIEVEQRLKELVRKGFHHLDAIVQRHLPSATWVWEPDSGVIELHQSLSIIHWEDLTTLPQVKLTNSDEEDASKLSDFYYNLFYNIQNTKFDIDIRKILPPFGAHAVMAGDYHYYTFDKKYFRFAGDCSYVLIADLLHHNFSLMVTYDSRGDTRKKSYTLISDKRSIEIFTSNFKVTLDGKKVELPLQVGPTFIRRQESGLEVFDSRGFHIACTLSPSLCTVSISGWYFGKLGGLLGTYDNERSNDFKSPDGHLLTDVATFAHSWRVGENGQCKMKNFARNESVIMDVEDICQGLLKNTSSPLRPCFNKVDTKVFMDMCQYDVSRNQNSAARQETVCTAISAYVAECQKQNVDIWMPPSCVLCKLEGGIGLTSGENVTLQTNSELEPPKSSDIVIILQEAPCVTRIRLTDMLTKLESALKSRGLTDNRYTIVGFGGRGHLRKPHVLTSSSNVWAHWTLFKIPDVDMDGDEDADLYEAIEYASALGFRAGVSKTMIAVMCGKENCGDESRFADTLTLLVENDVKLHLVTTKEFSVKGTLKKPMDIFGIDGNGVYVSRPPHSNKVDFESSLKRHIKLPKDWCTPIAMESNGSRFRMQNPSKALLEVWSQQLAEKSHPSECQRCECVPDKNGKATLMCHPCVSPGLRQLMEEWQKYDTLDLPEDFSETLDMKENDYEQITH